MRSLFAAFLAIPLVLGVPALVDAAGKNKNKGKGGPVPTQSHGKSGNVSTGTLSAAIISATERALIGDYVQKAKANSQGLPPGLAKRSQLPPGLQKHIDRTGQLPPGLEKRRLPGDLRGLLPSRKGQDYRVVGNDIVLIETATNLILDIMQGALR
ncbi:MAG: anti-virulence regulator CigR family protein [Alphaproteobacteria bacterium]